MGSGPASPNSSRRRRMPEIPGRYRGVAGWVRLESGRVLAQRVSRCGRAERAEQAEQAVGRSVGGLQYGEHDATRWRGPRDRLRVRNQ